MLHALRLPEADFAFAASMPSRYRGAFDVAEVHEHAAIVERRRGAPAHLEIWQRLPEGGAVLCVVADDRPGLLSLISAALLSQDIDVLGAKVFTRAASPRRAAEAVDFFWIQRRAAQAAVPLVRADVARIGDALRALITGEATVASVVRQARGIRAPSHAAFTHVTFAQAERDGLTEITVHTSDRPGLLLAIAHALFRAGLQVVSSEAATRDGRVLDRFVVATLDGSDVGPRARGLVQAQVLAAIDALSSGAVI